MRKQCIDCSRIIFSWRGNRNLPPTRVRWGLDLHRLTGICDGCKICGYASLPQNHTRYEWRICSEFFDCLLNDQHSADRGFMVSRQTHGRRQVFCFPSIQQYSSHIPRSTCRLWLGTCNHLFGAHCSRTFASNYKEITNQYATLWQSDAKD